jgi:nucleoid DNA-binding protein
MGLVIIQARAHPGHRHDRAPGASLDGEASSRSWIARNQRFSIAFAARAAVALGSCRLEEELNMAKSTNGKKSKPLSKSAILQAVSEGVGEEVSRKHVKQIVETLVSVGHKELKKNGIFVLHGFAKFVVVKKPARPAREGINPFTKEKQMFAAKPASKAVRARPVKAVKDAVA